MRYRLTTILAVGLSAYVITSAVGVSPDNDSLQGVWRLTSGEADGKPMPPTQLAEGKLVIQDAHYTVTLPKLGTVTGTQKLDAMQEPKTIDITDATGPQAGKTCLGIYELQGAEFRVVFASPGGARPTKFTTSPDSGQWMHVWKRAPE